MSERQIRAAETCHICGGISEMTLWRWLKRSDFPRPTYVGRYRYWRERDVEDWWDAQHQQAEVPAA
ncbi:MAG: transcriptional regulator [Kiritimatiellia bacterium]